MWWPRPESNWLRLPLQGSALPMSYRATNIYAEDKDLLDRALLSITVCCADLGDELPGHKLRFSMELEDSTYLLAKKKTSCQAAEVWCH